jgi:hypothetical protein
LAPGFKPVTQLPFGRVLCANLLACPSIFCEKVFRQCHYLSFKCSLFDTQKCTYVSLHYSIPMISLNNLPTPWRYSISDHLSLSWWTFFGLGGQRPLVPLLLLGPLFFPIILFGSTTLLTKMTGNSLHMQGPQTSQSHGSVSYRQWVRWWTLIESFLDFGFGISLGYV